MYAIMILIALLNKKIDYCNEFSPFNLILAWQKLPGYAAQNLITHYQSSLFY